MSRMKKGIPNPKFVLVNLHFPILVLHRVQQTFLSEFYSFDQHQMHESSMNHAHLQPKISKSRLGVAYKMDFQEHQMT